jgi:hypothetical protein
VGKCKTFTQAPEDIIDELPVVKSAPQPSLMTVPILVGEDESVALPFDIGSFGNPQILPARIDSNINIDPIQCERVEKPTHNIKIVGGIASQLPPGGSVAPKNTIIKVTVFIDPCEPLRRELSDALSQLTIRSAEGADQNEINQLNAVVVQARSALDSCLAAKI